MNAYARALNYAPLASSSDMRINPKQGRHISDKLGQQTDAGLSAVGVRLSGAYPVEDQFFVLGQESWASDNLQYVIGSFETPSNETLELARQALARIEARRGKDPKEWADNLGAIFSQYSD